MALNAHERRGFTPLEIRAPGRASRGFLTGFTLIELLVVITIIALLMAILFPVLRKAKEQGKDVVCRNNRIRRGDNYPTRSPISKGPQGQGAISFSQKAQTEPGYVRCRLIE